MTTGERRAAGRVLIAGWASFLHGEATAGDIAAAATVSGWLSAAGIDHDVAWSPVFGRWPTLEQAHPDRYGALVFTCGPAGGWQVAQLLDRYAGRRSVAVGVSVVDGTLSARFDAVIARDGGGAPTPDLAARAPSEWHRPPRQGWPVAAVVRANPQPEYGERGRHDEAHAAVDEALHQADVATIEVDTRVDPRDPRRRSAEQVRALLGAADVVVTTRLHGLVLGLAAGTPVVAIDAIAGGAKVAAQAAALGWPAVLTAPDVSPGAVTEMIGWATGRDAPAAVAASGRAAGSGLATVRERLLGALAPAVGSG